jgi:DNA-binding transcriptional LysR family regulator
MELRHLRYFIAVAEERSFTRAAERLWVAQPGLSRQIRDLERELGAQLFERRPRGVELTAVGELFLERARTASAAVDAAGTTGRDAEAGVIGTVRLGVSVGTSWHLTASVLDEFAQTRPGVELTLLEGYAGTLWHELRNGHIDALISTSGREISDLRTSRTLDLGSEPWVVLAGQSHRLAATGSVQASDLEGEQIAVTAHRDGSGYDRAIAGLLEELGVTAVLTKAAPGPSLQAAVARGDAVALTTAPAELHPEVIVRPLHPRQTIRFELLWREDSLSPALAEFVRLTAEQVDASTSARPRLAAVA